MVDNTNGIVYRSILTEQELEEIHDLEAKMGKKGIRYKIDPGTSSGIICIRDDILAGFMTVDCFDGKDIESAAIVDSTTDWDKMVAVLVAHANEKMAERILFICDPNDVPMTQKLESAGLTPLFSEYRMTFDAASFSPAVIHDISIKRAMQADRTYVRGLDEEAFGKSVDHTSPHNLNNTYIILQNSQPVGKLRVEEFDDVHGIYGVVVERRLRGKGIGAQALTLLLNELMILGIRNIYLEVDSENPSAFHLYKKLGFKVLSEFRYYPYKLYVGRNL